MKLDHGKLSTFPLAGTRPRGKTPEEDKALEADLLQDEKELAEHNMLVDLGRNDIGKISELGSVKVEKYLTVERYSCVMHLGSTVTGTIKKGKRCHRRGGCHLTCRNPFRGTEIPCLPDHSGTGTKQERHLRRCNRICGFHRKSGCVHCNPSGI